MIINFVGNYQSGYVGEVADQVHLSREMESLGNIVRRIPQDEWREYVVENCPIDKYPHVPEDIKADINIITKWHHFYDGRFIEELRSRSEAPVFYWVWDYMEDQGIPEWHLKMIESSDLYLGNDVQCGKYPSYLKNKLYYFPFDVCDGSIEKREEMKVYDVIFTGSCIGQGHRIEWIKEISKQCNLKVFSWNYKDWEKLGIEAYPAVYGKEYNEIIAQSRIIIGFSVNPDCWGYWSNRVGKVLNAGGFLLYEYAPGMELLLGDLVEYFSSPEELVSKIHYFLEHPEERYEVVEKGKKEAYRFTSQYRVKQLIILIERYLKTGGKTWNY